MKYILSFLLIASCAPATTPGGTAPDTCGKDGYASLIGAAYVAAMFPAGLNARVIAPDTAVTTDFQTDRLNIFTDETGLITRISCG